MASARIFNEQRKLLVKLKLTIAIQYLFLNCSFTDNSLSAKP